MPKLYFGSRGGVYYRKNGHKHYIRNMNAPGTPPREPDDPNRRPPPPPPPRKSYIVPFRISQKKIQINELHTYMRCMIEYIERNLEHLRNDQLQQVINTMVDGIHNNIVEINLEKIRDTENIKYLEDVLEKLKDDALTLNAFFKMLIQYLNDNSNPCHASQNVQSLFVQRIMPINRKLFT